ncbi:MAG: glycosyl transferase [Deltaproteobacteria bacterium HGW-Deltaproteobacteria-9]|nr:MAG: glycosyl transferase [Deltaproteobacteria bacterium HGW-Deltaproteobacteria-9]
MTPLIGKFGEFSFYALNNTEQHGPIGLLSGNSAKDGKNLSSFLPTVTTRYLLAISAGWEIRIADGAIRRLLQIAEDTQAGIVYSDFFLEKEYEQTPCPLIDYQPGSIRDDFHFGPVLLFSIAAIKAALKKYGALPRDPALALYDLRLKISLDYSIFHIPEFLYSVVAKKEDKDKGNSIQEEAHFAYVAARNAARQKKLEKVATNYLKLRGAYLPPRTKKAGPANTSFPVQASVIIPVYNRKKTIDDALQSALSQQTTFPFNIIVVDNHSTDGTTRIVKKLAARYPQIQHLIPTRRDLNIGGCWNEAIYSLCCGRYSVQLDSDDLYSSPETLQTIVDAFIEGDYALVVGSYTIVNEHLQKIPPGLIDHREWTFANGHNNALRINGLGAPRAFNTAVLRQIGFPNVGYGEDYAVALRIAREYKIGRIYSSLYLCRRWPENTDAALSVEKKNRYDFYKDKLRTMEIKARQTMNKRRA